MKVISSAKKVATAPAAKLTTPKSPLAKKMAKPKITIRVKDINGNNKTLRVARHMFLGSHNLMPKISMVKGANGGASYMAVRYIKKEKDDANKYNAKDDSM